MSLSVWVRCILNVKGRKGPRPLYKATKFFPDNRNIFWCTNFDRAVKQNLIFAFLYGSIYKKEFPLKYTQQSISRDFDMLIIRYNCQRNNLKKYVRVSQERMLDKTWNL